MCMPWIADAHTDFLSTLVQQKTAYTADLHTQRHISLSALQTGQVGLQIFAAFVDRQNPEHPTVQCLKQIQAYYALQSAWGAHNLIPATLDTLALPRPSPTRTVLSIEGGEACAGSSEILSLFSKLGVRAMGLVWNHPNELGFPAVLPHTQTQGLTHTGLSMLRSMEKQRIAVDISHLNEKGFWDCLSHASVSPFASHSNAFSLCPHPRNLKDDQIRALIQSRGFIGINFNPPFLSEQPRCSLSTIVSHILHILDLGGEDILGFGSDFEGVSSLPAGMFGAQSYPALLSALQTAGVDQPLLDKLAHQNLVRYLSLFY